MVLISTITSLHYLEIIYHISPLFRNDYKKVLQELLY